MFALVLCYTSALLADCYRSGDPISGKRNYTYMEAVQSYLGGAKVKICGLIQYCNLSGIMIGYTIATSVSMMWVELIQASIYALNMDVIINHLWIIDSVWTLICRAVMRSNCFHNSGNKSPCHASSNPYMIIFGIIEILLSQIPDFSQIWWLSIIAAIMSLTYSSIGLGLGISTVVGMY